MHKLLIDWLGKSHLKPDTALATKRWNLADAFEKKSSRKELLQLLRAFLFEPVSAELIQSLTDQFLEIDKEFPATKNTQEVRLMAGVVMVVSFSGRTLNADAFALGIKAASLSQDRCKPAQPLIIDESAEYLEAQANRFRPSDFGAFDQGDAIAKKLEEFGEAIADEDQRKKAGEEFAEILHQNYNGKIQRLAEEVGLLWWLLGGFSNALGQKTEELNAGVYALIAAAEVAERIQLLPPPPSIYPMLGRSLASCKEPDARITLKDLVKKTDPTWRAKFLANHKAVDCADFVPIFTALVKMEEAGDADILTKTLHKVCPGVSANHKFTPLEAAKQFYNELMFLKAFTKLDK